MRTLIVASLLVLLAAVACGTEPTAAMAEPTNTPDTEQSTKYDRAQEALR